MHTVVGLARIGVHSYSIASKLCPIILFKMMGRPLTDVQEDLMIQTVVDLRGIIRGLIELPPLIGGLTSWYWNNYQLTPAQKLAYKVQEIYQTRIKGWSTIKNGKKLEEINLEDPDLSEDFVDFINKQKVKISTDQEKVDRFVHCFNDGLVKDPIFDDKMLPYYALAAFSKGRIDRYDMATIMELYMAKQCFVDCTVSTFESATEEEVRLLTHATNNGAPLNKARNTDKKKNEFLEKVKVFAKKQTIFWYHQSLITYEEIQQMPAWQAVEVLRSPIGSLGASLVFLGGTKTYNRQDVSLSYGLEQLVLNVKYNKTNNPFNPKLGLFSPMYVKQGVVKKDQRVCATFFPGAVQPTNVHHSLELPTIITTHDKTHAQILHQYSESTMSKIKRMLEIFQEVTGFKMSKEIWEIVEVVAVSVIGLENEEEIFVKFFRDRAGNPQDVSLRELFWNQEGKNRMPTPILWIVWLDMIENAHKYNFNASITAHLNEEEKGLLEFVTNHVKNEFKKEMTFKEKVWILQEHYRGVTGKIEVTDDQLQFKKVQKGRRKNMVVLVRKN